MSHTIRTILLTVIFAAVLVVRSGAAAQTAAALNYGQAVTGSLGAGQQKDYTFAGKSGDKLTIDMTFIGGNIDPFVSLYDSQGRLIGEDDNSGGKSNAHLQGLVLPADGAYRLVTSNVNKSDGGDFSLIVLKETAKGAIRFEGDAGGKEAFQLSRPLNHTHVTYSVKNTLSNFPAQAVKATIQQAFQSWANVTPLTFEEVSPSTQSDLRITFQQIDGPLNVLGETCPPSSPCAGDINFDSEEPWTLGAPQGDQAISFLGVASHEFGHAVGLLHSSDASALMYPEYSPYNLKPAADDIAGVQRLYGAGSSATNPTSIPGSNTGNNPAQPQVNGTISDSPYVNYWDFDVDTGDTVTITMKRTSGNLDSFIVLLDANNHILAYDDDSAGNRDAIFRNIHLPQRGTYTVAATRADQAQGHTSGNYTLTIQYGTTTGAPAQPTPVVQSGQTGSVKVSKGTNLSQAQSLDQTLDAPFSESLTPGTQTRSATVQANQTYALVTTWCAKDQNTLTKNLPNLVAKFTVANNPVDQNLITQTQPHTANGQSCVDWFIMLSGWQPGQVTLSRTLTLKSPVFDGNSIYAAGDYLYEYNVQVQ